MNMNMDEERSTAQSFMTAKVRSYEEKPFSSFTPWEEVIRYRSDSSLMVEYCIPEERMPGLQTAYGSDLSGFKAESGAQADVGPATPHASGKRWRSLLITGTMLECVKAARILHVYKELATRDRKSLKKLQTSETEGRGHGVEAAEQLAHQDAPAAPTTRNQSERRVWKKSNESATSTTSSRSFPKAQLDLLQAIYGPDLLDLTIGKFKDARITVTTRQAGLDPVISISGPRIPVDKVISTITQWTGPGRSEKGWLLVRSRASEARGEGNLSVAHNLRFATVKSEAEYRSEDIVPGKAVLRARSEDELKAVIEIVVAEESWRDIVAAGGVEALKQGMKIPVQVKVKETGRWRGLEVRSVFIEGSLPAVGQVKKRILVLGNVDQNVADRLVHGEQAKGGSGWQKAGGPAGGSSRGRAGVLHRSTPDDVDALNTKNVVTGDGASSILGPVDTSTDPATTSRGLHIIKQKQESSASVNSNQSIPGPPMGFERYPHAHSFAPLLGRPDHENHNITHIDFPVIFKRYLIGLKGRTRVHIQQQSGVRRLDIRDQGGKPQAGKPELCSVYIEDADDERRRRAVKLLNERRLWAEKSHPYVAAIERWKRLAVRASDHEVAEEAPPKRYEAMLSLPGQDKERRSAFAARIVGRQGYGTYEIATKSFTSISKSPHVEHCLRIGGFQPEDVEAAIYMIRQVANGKEDIRDGERDGCMVLATYVQVPDLMQEGKWEIISREDWMRNTAEKHTEDLLSRFENKIPDPITLRDERGKESMDITETSRPEVSTANANTESVEDGITSSVERSTTDEDHSGGQYLSRVALLPHASQSTRAKVDDVLRRDKLETATWAERLTNCSVSCVSHRDGAGLAEWTILGRKADVERAKAFLQLRLYARSEMLGFDPQKFPRLLLELSSAPIVPLAQLEAPKAKQEELRVNMRAVARPLTQPVVLITSRMSARAGADKGPREANSIDHCRGVTVSSFNTVTLQPKPVITFNLKVPSRTWDAMVDSGQLSVYIMAATPSAAAITHIFTQPHSDPADPFYRLRDRGVDVKLTADPSMPPRIVAADGAVLARVDATLLKDKCVWVGDHVVVLAKVHYVTLPAFEPKVISDKEERWRNLEGSAGLAYSRQSYRGLGDVIELPDQAEKAEVVGARTADASLVPDEAVEELVLDNEEDDGQALSQAERTMTSAEEDDNVDAFVRELENESAASAPKGRTRRAAEDEEDDYDFGFAAAYRKELDNAVSGALTPESASRTFSPTSTRATSSKTRPLPQFRKFSSMRYFATSLVRHDRQPMDKDLEHLADPSVLRQTVGEFFGESGELKARGRMRELLNDKDIAWKAMRELQNALRDGSLTPERSLQLETTIAVKEGRIAKKLGLRAADELRRMLDTGTVDVRRSQWLESAVEKAMVVCVDEGRRVRQMLDEKKIAPEQFEAVGQRLEREHGVLNEQSMRLRSMLEDEDGGGDDD
ncbi:hypothetical protein LTR62_003344 [Meristemomyces frigidus]|uniref:K Homology domain-containing protein n=1 Tax=Meristemomyces frigidus TaxID=1508187 RepID=A0AAN7TF02_9PEZI|nr:hypothetical protein LTR62_003344 [Meristemomyces frigidus]